jgi:hypothetical protein
MATTTTNFGWDIPQSTDLVKDGATAIAALGQDIDTAFVDFKGGTTGQVLKKTSGTDLDVEWGTVSSGLTLINTTSFSGVSSQAITSFASSTYKNYKIIMRWTQTANTTLSFRVRSGVTDYTSAEYNNAVFFARSSGTSSLIMVTNQNQTSATLFNSAGHDSGVTSINQLDMLVSNIFEATSTSSSTRLTVADATGNTLALFGSHRVRDGVSYDGLNFILSTGNMTGTIQVFGVNE